MRCPAFDFDHIDVWNAALALEALPGHIVVCTSLFWGWVTNHGISWVFGDFAVRDPRITLYCGVRAVAVGPSARWFTLTDVIRMDFVISSLTVMGVTCNGCFYFSDCNYFVVPAAQHLRQERREGPMECVLTRVVSCRVGEPVFDGGSSLVSATNNISHRIGVVVGSQVDDQVTATARLFSAVRKRRERATVGVRVNW
jgi:hypothetical protein